MKIILTKEQYSDLEYAAENYEMNVTQDYSGRGMYGNICFGVSGDYIDMYGVFKFLRDTLDDENLADDIMESRREDSLGFGSIIYFESVEVEGADEEDD